MPNSVSEATESARKTVESKADDMKDKVTSVANRTADAINNASDQASDAVNSLRSRASDTADKVKDYAEQQKNAGASAMRSFAGTVHGVASTMDDQVPAVANVVHKVADSVDTASRQLQNSSIDDLVSAIAGMARRQPIGTVFGAFVAGIVITRIFSSRDR